MNVVIIKYNAGNIRSVYFALRRLGIEPLITDNVKLIENADKVIFPGVGEASGTMRYLKDKGLDVVIKRLKQPVLGICLGMQLLCSHSAEGNTPGLGIFDVDVQKFEPKQNLKIPHMGWNKVAARAHRNWYNINDQFVYFVHSYYVPICDYSVLTTDYGSTFSAAIQRDNFYGVQFHPEKSGIVGAMFLQNFLKL